MKIATESASGANVAILNKIKKEMPNQRVGFVPQQQNEQSNERMLCLRVLMLSGISLSNQKTQIYFLERTFKEIYQPFFFNHTHVNKNELIAV